MTEQTLSIADFPGVEGGFLARFAPTRRLARRFLLAKLRDLENGSLRLVDAGEATRLGAADAPPAATVHVHDPRFYPKLLFGGSIGAAESYMAGHWQADDLVAVFRFFLQNRQALEGIDAGTARLERVAHWIGQRLRANTRAGSRRNISAHYDLSNDFFRLFLDQRMMYSAAIFERGDETLDEAQVAKLDRLCRKLDLGPDDHLLEIGTGWGGFAVHAVETRGCRVTTTTISREQYDVAVETVRQRGLEDRIQVLLSDYRDLEGTYDKLVSIEMVEAVGHEYLDDYFRVCADRLAPGGRMALQSITIADRLYERYRRSVDFIQRYVFPGGALLSVAALSRAAAKSDLQIVHLEDIGPHYATTLRHWHERFVEHADAVRALGFGERFVRLWELYMTYCEAGFLERAIGNVQVVLTKPEDRGAPLLGALGPLGDTP